METICRYNNIASNWNRKLIRLGYARAYASLFSHGTLASGSTLDVGTGSGLFAQSWVEAGGSRDLTLLDPSLAMLRQARMQLGFLGLRPKCISCGFEHLQPDLKYTTILASHVLEHISDPVGAMQRLSMMLNRNGRLYLVVSKPHWCNWLIWLRYRHRWMRSEVICELAEAAGLRAAHIHQFSSGPPSRTSLGYIFIKP